MKKCKVNNCNNKHSANRKCNLRISTHQENCRNNKAKGYNFHKITKKWRSYICVNGKYIHLGLFSSKQKAIDIRKKAEIKYFKKFKHKIP